jgi:hypothetical protein
MGEKGRFGLIWWFMKIWRDKELWEKREDLD